MGDSCNGSKSMGVTLSNRTLLYYGERKRYSSPWDRMQNRVAHVKESIDEIEVATEEFWRDNHLNCTQFRVWGVYQDSWLLFRWQWLAPGMKSEAKICGRWTRSALSGTLYPSLVACSSKSGAVTSWTVFKDVGSEWKSLCHRALY